MNAMKNLFTSTRAGDKPREREADKQAQGNSTSGNNSGAFHPPQRGNSGGSNGVGGVKLNNNPGGTKSNPLIKP